MSFQTNLKGRLYKKIYPTGFWLSLAVCAIVLAALWVALLNVPVPVLLSGVAFSFVLAIIGFWMIFFFANNHIIKGSLLIVLAIALVLCTNWLWWVGQASVSKLVPWL